VKRCPPGPAKKPPVPVRLRDQRLGRRPFGTDFPGCGRQGRADVRREAVMTQHRLPQHGDGIRNNELRGLHRVIGVEAVITLHVAGKVNHLRHGLLRWPGILGAEPGQGVARQPAEREPPPGPLGVMNPAVPGHVSTVLRQPAERRHLIQHGTRVLLGGGD
jgi:hypothetical protein